MTRMPLAQDTHMMHAEIPPTLKGSRAAIFHLFRQIPAPEEAAGPQVRPQVRPKPQPPLQLMAAARHPAIMPAAAPNRPSSAPATRWHAFFEEDRFEFHTLGDRIAVAEARIAG